MRIVILGETPSLPTGFGQQVRILCEGLVGEGHEVVLMSESFPVPQLRIPGLTEWRYTPSIDLANVDSQLHVLCPDVVLVFGHTGFIAHMLKLRSAPSNCPVFYWLPYEGSVLPQRFHKEFQGMPASSVIHLSQFASRLWAPLVNSPLVIPHAVDDAIWRSPEVLDIPGLRKYWSEKLRFPIWEDDLVIINVDRNIWHKRWDLTFDYVRRLQGRINRRVVLIAHTRKVQSTEGNHPPGYDLPYMEKLYQIQNRVCYTEFEWTSSLTRSDLRDLILLSDVRISTSSGEGFGIPTAEVAFIGKLQIVNDHTTMGEILNPENPMIVESGSMEERCDSLWPVADVDAMVKRTLGFLDDWCKAEFAINLAKKWAHERFRKNDVVAMMSDVFKQAEATKLRSDLRTKYRWGFAHQANMPKVFADLARVSQLIKSDSTLFEFGCGDGLLIEICSEMGIQITGIESDLDSAKQASSRSRPLMLLEGMGDNWPVSDIIVATDVQDQLYGTGGMEWVETCFKKFNLYEWALVRLYPRYTWGTPIVSPTFCVQVLQSNGLHRRLDVESILKTRFKNFEHQVWSRNLVDVPDKIQEIQLRG